MEVLEVRSTSIVRMDDYEQSGENKPNPDYVIIREIDYATDGGLRFYFSRGENIDLRSDGRRFEDIVDGVCDGSIGPLSTPPPLRSPYASPLSLHNDRLSHVIYRLARRNWQFWRKGWPITVSKPAYDAEVYFSAFRADARGHIAADRGDRDVRNGCHVAYFIADGAKAIGEEPDGYMHAINLHVDLVMTGLAPERYIPIIIDPDVRHPGGSGA